MTDLGTAPYRIDFASYNAFVLTWLKRTFYNRRNLLRFVLFAALMAVASFWQTRGFVDPVGMTVMATFTILGSLMTSAILVYAVAPGLVWLWQAAVFATTQSKRPSQTVGFSDDGIVKTSNDDSHTYPWNDVHDVVETRQAVLIFTHRNSALIVPKSAFATPADASAFAGKVVERAFRRPHPDADKNF